MTKTKQARGDFSPHGLKKHGSEPASLYARWKHMKQRCFDENCKSYLDYGGRGISVCEAWQKDFAPFRDWALANGYQEHLTIDRENNDGDYCPENCRWVDRKTQNRNSRRVKLSRDAILSIREDARPLKAIAKDHGVSDVSVSNVKRGKTWA